MANFYGAVALKVCNPEPSGALVQAQRTFHRIFAGEAKVAGRCRFTTRIAIRDTKLVH